MYKTELVPPTAIAIAMVKVFLAIGQHVGSSVATRLRSCRVVLNKPPSKTLNYTQGAEDARRALAFQPGEPRIFPRRQAQPALADHSSLHKFLPPFSSRTGHLSLPPPVGFELPWAASPNKGKGSLERSVARAIGSGCFCCCFSSFCLTFGLCSRPARHIALHVSCPPLLDSGVCHEESLQQWAYNLFSGLLQINYWAECENRRLPLLFVCVLYIIYYRSQLATYFILIFLLEDN